MSERFRRLWWWAWRMHVDQWKLELLVLMVNLHFPLWSLRGRARMGKPVCRKMLMFAGLWVENWLELSFSSQTYETFKWKLKQEKQVGNCVCFIILNVPGNAVFVGKYWEECPEVAYKKQLCNYAYRMHVQIYILYTLYIYAIYIYRKREYSLSWVLFYIWNFVLESTLFLHFM